MNSLDISPDTFRELADRAVELAASYLDSLDSRPIFPNTSGAETERLFHSPLPETGEGAAAFQAVHTVMDHSRAQNGRFFGYVQGPGEPVAALGDFIASILTQNMTAWRSSPAGVTIERTVAGWLAEAVGCPGFSGTLTGGGSPANLMGLAMAREAKLAANEKGLLRSGAGAIYASSEIHMSIPKAVALLGLGRDCLRLIPVDENLRMIPAELQLALDGDRKAGKIPIAVIASAGTVNTGAVDPLSQIAAIAHNHGAWLHVDGAYGALAAIAAPEKFAGLNQADSLSLDPHKWLYQPLDCGCLLYKDSGIARQTFAYTGDYAKTLSTDPVESFAFFEESMELSRRFRALKLWLSLRYHGLAAFRVAIRKDLDLAQRLAASIRKEPQMELMAPVELSAVCFRYRGVKPASDGELNRWNAGILKQVVRHGRVYLSNATLRGKFCLRACIVNCRTKPSDIDEIVSEVLTATRALGY